MATCYINEYRGLGTVPGPIGSVQVMQAPGGFITANNVAIGAEAKSAAFSANTYLIEVRPDAICSFLVGDSPTATTGNMRLAADSVSYICVSPGQKISIITNT